MNRYEFHKRFDVAGPVIFPVIHVLDNAQAERNTKLALTAGATGVFLINHDFGVEEFLPIIQHVRSRFPKAWLGVNFLAVTGKDAFPILAELQDSGTQVDAYWADDARIDEHADAQTEASEISRTRVTCGWDGLYFGGTAFKKQREVDPADYRKSASIAVDWMDVVTTSGVATGHEADLDKIASFRSGIGDAPLGIASGITPENVSRYASDIDAMLVATGINVKDDFYNLDQQRLELLLRICREHPYSGTH